MRVPKKVRAIDRRRFLAGAGAAALIGPVRAHAQTAAPSPTPTPIRVQTPDVAFADALNQIRADWSAAHDAADLILSIVPAEPASDSLLNDARSGARRFSGSFVPNWLLPDLVRDNFILPTAAPSEALPASMAQLRSFGGAWYASDLDHDCDLLYYRNDVLETTALTPAETWDELEAQVRELAEREIGGIALPLTHAQQVVDHFVSMAASTVLVLNPQSDFWFAPEQMTPAIASDAHTRALEQWQALGRTMPETLRAGSTGDLWQAFLDGAVAYLVAPADFVPFALDRGIDPGVLGVAELPGRLDENGTVVRVGNVSGASWGGVVMSSTGDRARTVVSEFLTSLASADERQKLWIDRTTGVLPAPASSSEAASMSEALVTAGWPDQVSSAWLTALHATFSNPIQLPALRIAETQRYLLTLESRIVPFLTSDEGTAGETLDAAAADWTEINSAIGVATQRDLFEQSLMPAPAS